MKTRKRIEVPRRLLAGLLAFIIAFGWLPAAIEGNGSGPIGPSIEITNFSEWPSGFANSSAYFGEAVFDDGEHIWMIPQETNMVVKLNIVTGEMTGYNNWPDGFAKSNGAFSGGVFDGESIWMIPALADRVIKVDSDGEMTGYNSWPDGFVGGTGPFNKGVYDGEHIWLIPSNANMVVKVNPTTGEMIGYNNWPAGFVKGNYAFNGAVYDGENIWLIPSQADRVIKLDPETGEMTGYNDWPTGFTRGGYAFADGIFDGEFIWMLPNGANMIIKLDPVTGEMTGYNDWPSGHNYSSVPNLSLGAYDGQYIWTKYGSNQFYRIDTDTGEVEGFNKPNEYAGSYSAVYDGLNVWMIPFGTVSGTTAEVFRLSSIPNMHPAHVVDGEVNLSWTPVNGATGYSIFQSLVPSTEGSEMVTVTDSVYTVTDLPLNITHYYTVKAKFPTRESRSSNEVSVTLQPYNTNLSALTLSAGELSPAFSAGTTEYTASVNHSTSNIMITPTTVDADAGLTINGEEAESGTPFGPVPLQVGNNTIEVEVTAPSGKTRIYTITVVRQSAPTGNGSIHDGENVVTEPALQGLFIHLNGKQVNLRTFDLTQSSITLEAEPINSRVFATVPASVLKTLQEKNDELSIEIKAPFGSYHLPVDLTATILELEDILKNEKLSLKDISFKITLTDRSNDAKIQRELKETWPNTHVLGSIVDYEINILNHNINHILAKVDKIEEPLIRQIPLSMEEGISEAFWGAFNYDEATKAFEYSSAHKVKDGNEWFVEIRSSKNGINLITQNNVQFADMTGHWGENTVHLAAAKGLVRGMSVDQFAPSQEVRKNDFKLMLDRALGKEYETYSEDSNGLLTREEMAGFLLEETEWGNFLDNEGENVSSLQNYEDKSQVDPAYYDAVEAMIRSNIMIGMSTSKFDPQGEVTRVQAVTALLRTLSVLGLIDKIE
ncbi:cadherin-like beta sandwich domain-containing protein [Bacillus horti]|uniref:S-layer homology domain-containing protein n=1 Tax=Caldalkalibacillus horti TaxID=77523 RepID=A0ABT9VZV3_9BACI|nr:cadherin-like beta sandwich domain-containing protein [Bacillus horti]MDQ0166514.1 hypothetical protein [Bacillus horti]